MFNGLQVALKKMFFIPVEIVLHLFIFIGQGCIRYGPCIGTDAHGYTGIINFAGRMIFYFIIHIGLNITGGTNFQVNIFFFQKGKQLIIFRTSYSMTDPGRMKMFSAFPTRWEHLWLLRHVRYNEFHEHWQIQML